MFMSLLSSVADSTLTSQGDVFLCNVKSASEDGSESTPVDLLTQLTRRPSHEFQIKRINKRDARTKEKEGSFLHLSHCLAAGIAIIPLPTDSFWSFSRTHSRGVTRGGLYTVLVKVACCVKGLCESDLVGEKKKMSFVVSSY
ncbi:hypothetical protein TNCV_4496161 [Trichonephila clavipes]|nr:hypothetical protein TNCV_4496161 [Trichonephila clavipes]